MNDKEENSNKEEVIMIYCRGLEKRLKTMEEERQLLQSEKEQLEEERSISKI